MEEESARETFLQAYASTLTQTPVHVCVPGKMGYCDDNERDWCNRCEACTVWHGEFCSVCELQWGEEA